MTAPPAAVTYRPGGPPPPGLPPLLPSDVAVTVLADGTVVSTRAILPIASDRREAPAWSTEVRLPGGEFGEVAVRYRRGSAWNAHGDQVERHRRAARLSAQEPPVPTAGTFLFTVDGVPTSDPMPYNATAEEVAPAWRAALAAQAAARASAVTP